MSTGAAGPYLLYRILREVLAASRCFEPSHAWPSPVSWVDSRTCQPPSPQDVLTVSAWRALTAGAPALLFGRSYMTFAIGAAAEAVAVLVVAPSVDRFGRHNIVSLGQLVGGAACIACANVSGGITQAALAAVGKFGCSGKTDQVLRGLVGVLPHMLLLLVAAGKKLLQHAPQHASDELQVCAKRHVLD